MLHKNENPFLKGVKHICHYLCEMTKHAFNQALKITKHTLISPLRANFGKRGYRKAFFLAKAMGCKQNISSGKSTP